MRTAGCKSAHGIGAGAAFACLRGRARARSSPASATSAGSRTNWTRRVPHPVLIGHAAPRALHLRALGQKVLSQHRAGVSWGTQLRSGAAAGGGARRARLEVPDDVVQMRDLRVLGLRRNASPQRCG